MVGRWNWTTISTAPSPKRVHKCGAIDIDPYHANSGRKRRPIGRARRVVVAEEFYITSKRNKRELPAGAMGIVEADQLRAEADREHRHFHAAQPGDQEMTQLVEKHDQGEDEEEGQAAPASNDAESRDVIEKVHDPPFPIRLPTGAVFYDAFAAISGKRSPARDRAS